MYRAEDVEMRILDQNHETLRLCWGCLAQKNDWDDIPECLRGVVFADHARVDWATRPPGTATLGLGPIPATLMRSSGVAPVGPFFGFDFSRAPNGHRRIGELRGGCGTVRILRARTTADATGPDEEPFPELNSDGVFEPKTYGQEVMRSLSERLQASGVGASNGSNGSSNGSNPAAPRPSLRSARRGISSGISSFASSVTNSLGSLGRVRVSGRTISRQSSYGSSAGSSRAESDSDAEIDSVDERDVVDGMASCLTARFMGYHPLCRWNVNDTVKKLHAAEAGRTTRTDGDADAEAEAEAEEMERTIQSLWRAWLLRYDADKNGTLDLEELRTFARSELCPSGDAHMQNLHEWASNALTCGDLDEAFKRVDVDGSGELEFPEFRAMLLTE
jgi:hypothetical protein